MNINSTFNIWYFLSLHNDNLYSHIFKLIFILTYPLAFHQVRNLSVSSYTSGTLINAKGQRPQLSQTDHTTTHDTDTTLDELGVDDDTRLK